MNDAAVARHLCALVHAIVPDDRGDPQPIIGKNLAAAFCLCNPMLVCAAPILDRRFVSEKGKRKHLARLAKTFEALDRYEAVDAFEQRPKLGGKIKIVLLSFRLRPDFEDDCDHAFL